MRHDIFHVSERYPVPISSFAVPSDITIFGGRWADDTYYADYAGIARKYRPEEILEIGVRFGYSGIAMCLGALAGRPNYDPEVWILGYDGIDACFFSHPEDPAVSSNEVASANFAAQTPSVGVELFRHDTRAGLPEKVCQYLGVYDLVNVDGDHSYEGCYRDLVNIWPLTAPGAVVIVDDTGMTDVKRAVEQFRDEHLAELQAFQWHENERGLALLQRNAG